ncbi:MAG: membrane protein insertion efficiency factor YidD [Haliea sp.]
MDCNFEPSCSEYARQAIIQFGAARGVMLALRRVNRCRDRDQVSKLHDPVPPRRV